MKDLRDLKDFEPALLGLLPRGAAAGRTGTTFAALCGAEEEGGGISSAAAVSSFAPPLRHSYSAARNARRFAASSRSPSISPSSSSSSSSLLPPDTEGWGTRSGACTAVACKATGVHGIRVEG